MDDFEQELLVLVVTDNRGRVSYCPRIKASEGPKSDPHIAFRSRETFDYYVQERFPDPTFDARPLDELRQAELLEPGASILVFDSVSEIIDAYADWEAWDPKRKIQAI